ncbi:MAG: ATP-binding protein [Deferrisomatales bacterium]
MAIVSTVAGVSALHLLAYDGPRYFRAFYGELYFVPLVLASLWFGMRGALATAAGISAFFLPFTWFTWDAEGLYGWDNLLELLLLIAVGLGLGLFRDRERKAQQELREAQALAAMGQAVSAAAHDMRSPLTAIGGFADSVLKRLPPEDPARERLQIVVQETRRLEALTDNMLDFTRPLDLELEPTDLGRLAEESIEVVRAGMAGGAGPQVDLETELAPGLPPVTVDPKRMMQVLINLLGNAVQASPKGGTVRVRTLRKGPDLVLEVIDEGPGVPPGKQEDLFLPFFTTKKEGTGLGLPIAKKIVEAHEGRLEIVNNPSRGATARVALPAR